MVEVEVEVIDGEEEVGIVSIRHPDKRGVKFYVYVRTQGMRTIWVWRCFPSGPMTKEWLQNPLSSQT